MASAIKSALPSHLKPGNASGNGDEPEFAGKHHGKTRSHMVSACHKSQNALSLTFTLGTITQPPS